MHLLIQIKMLGLVMFSELITKAKQSSQFVVHTWETKTDTFKTPWQSKYVSNIEFITVHGLKEGHIAPYTDIEFRLTKYQTYIIMKSLYKSLPLIFEETITLLTTIKHVKTDGIKKISQQDKIKVV